MPASTVPETRQNIAVYNKRFVKFYTGHKQTRPYSLFSLYARVPKKVAQTQNSHLKHCISWGLGVRQPHPI
jgi:hypothetical protein